MESILDLSYEIVEDESGNILDCDNNSAGEDTYYINLNNDAEKYQEEIDIGDEQVDTTNIYLVRREDEISFDQFESFVCYAETIEEARRLHPIDFKDWPDGDLNREDCWNSNLLSIQKLGISSLKETKILTVSFRAG